MISDSERVCWSLEQPAAAALGQRCGVGGGGLGVEGGVSSL